MPAPHGSRHGDSCGFEVQLSPNGNGLIFHPDRGEMYLLNRTGVMAFRLYQNGCPSAEIARRLTREFSVPTERAAVDVRDFFTQARAYGVSVDP
ncbi:MAG TPA: PqqD family protein [Methylomirabilota bacterium]|nr:PqqD family protein [Methylomirabilota bacterium]